MKNDSIIEASLTNSRTHSLRQLYVVQACMRLVWLDIISIASVSSMSDWEVFRACSLNSNSKWLHCQLTYLFARDAIYVVIPWIRRMLWQMIRVSVRASLKQTKSRHDDRRQTDDNVNYICHISLSWHIGLMMSLINKHGSKVNMDYKARLEYKLYLVCVQYNWRLMINVILIIR